MTPISSAPKLTRRTMLKATAAAGGGLILSVSIPRLNAALAAEPDADFAPNAFVRIDPDGKVTFTIPQVEMGQGIYTALSMILAEELDAPFEHVTAVAAPPNDKLYGEPASRVSGDRRLDLRPRLLEADANRRRDRPGHAGASRGGEVERRSVVLPDGERRGPSRRERPEGGLRRACAGGRRFDAAARSAAQARGGFQADRQVAETARHARQGQRQSRLRDRRAAARA